MEIRSQQVFSVLKVKGEGQGQRSRSERRSRSEGPKYVAQYSAITIWPASREKGPSDITNSVDPDQYIYNIENSYT